MENKSRLNKIFRFILCLIIAYIMLVPFVWMLSASFKDNNHIFSYPVEWIPKNPTFENYYRTWNDIDFPIYFLNSLKISVLVTILQLFTCSLAAFSFTKLKFPGRDKIFFFYISTMMVPWHAIMIPQFLTVRFMNLYNTHASLILLGTFSAFGVFILRQNMLSIPDSLHEAAKIDGCSPFRVYWSIILPLTKSGLATLAILTFNGTWNDYMAPMIYLDSNNLKTIQLGLALFRQEYAADYGAIMAGTVISIIPVVVVYVFAQNNIIEGVAFSGLKA